MTPLPEKVGKYEIVGLAGQGNMGVVYVGYDPFTDREVAVKVCTEFDTGDEATRRMARKLFFNEAHTAGALEHPNILRVLDAGEDHGRPYVVTEYVRGGGTLEPHTRPEHLLPVAAVAQTVACCASALDYAHRRGVVHRDIKPSNIMLTPQGEVKIGDFGIAQRILDDTAQLSGPMGSPRYMAPEQVDDRAVSGQTDIYALGVVMYELLVGQPPFTAPTLAELFRQIRHDPPVPPSERRPELPDALDRVVGCALEKDLRHRYHFASELANDLASLFRAPRPLAAHEMDADQRFEMLRELPFFNDFADYEVVEVARLARWSRLPGGRAVNDEDGAGALRLLVVSGHVEVRDGLHPPQVLAPGDCFGLDSGSRSSPVLVARSDAVVLELAPHRLAQLAEGAQLRFGDRFLEALLTRLGRRRGSDTSTEEGDGPIH